MNFANPNRHEIEEWKSRGCEQFNTREMEWNASDCGHKRLCNQPLRDMNEFCERVKLKSVRSVVEISSLKDQPKMHYLLKISEAACDKRNHQIKHQFVLARCLLDCKWTGTHRHTPERHQGSHKIHVVRLFIFHIECGRNWTRFAFHCDTIYNRHCDLI